MVLVHLLPPVIMWRCYLGSSPSKHQATLPYTPPGHPQLFVLVYFSWDWFPASQAPSLGHHGDVQGARGWVNPGNGTLPASLDTPMRKYTKGIRIRR